ncbi:MAG: hypothetical protein WD601_02370, partial [Pseudohongiellaceae bacterium]
MRIIIVDEKHGQTRALVMKGWLRATMTLCLLGLPVVLGYFGYQFSSVRTTELYNDKAAQAWVDKLETQEQAVQRSREQAQAQLQALTLRVASLQARLLRLDALGERLTSISNLDDGEFDFSQEPAVGGPEHLGIEETSTPDFIQVLDELARQIESRQQQLSILDSLLSGRQ